MHITKLSALIHITVCMSSTLSAAALGRTLSTAEKPRLHGSIKSPVAAGAVLTQHPQQTKQITVKPEKRGLDLVVVGTNGSYISNLSPGSIGASKAQRESMADCAAKRAHDLIQSKDYEGALRELNEALMAYPDKAYVVGRAELYELMGRYDDAARDWNKIYSDCPQAYHHLLLGAEFFKRRGDYASALKFCDLSLKAYSTPEGYLERAEIYQSAGNNAKAVQAAYQSYRAALEQGSDGQTQRQLLKTLLGKEPAVPQAPKKKVAATLAIIKALSESKKPFSPALTSQLTHLPLTELPLQGSSAHTGSFESLTKDSSSQWWHVDLDRPDAGGYRNCLLLELNPSVVSISPDEVREQFGPCTLTPDQSTRCVIAPPHLEYIRSWGKLTFTFHDRGFKSLCGVQMWVDSEPAPAK